MNPPAGSPPAGSPPAGASPAAPPRSAPLADILVLAGRTVRLSLRDPVTLALSTFLPLILLLLITASFATMLYPDGGYADYVDHSLPLFMLMGISFTMTSTALAVVADLGSGYDARLRTMPVAAFAPLAGRVLGDTVRSVVTVVAVVAVGSGIGFRFTAGPWGVVGFLLLPLLFGCAMSCLAVAAATFARDGEAASAALNTLLLVLSFLSTGLVPLADLPGWIQPFARVNPFSVTVEAMRALAHGGATTGPVLGALAWSVALAAGFGLLATHRYRHRGAAS